MDKSENAIGASKIPKQWNFFFFEHGIIIGIVLDNLNFENPIPSWHKAGQLSENLSGCLFRNPTVNSFTGLFGYLVLNHFFLLIIEEL